MHSSMVATVYEEAEDANSLSKKKIGKIISAINILTESIAQAKGKKK